MTDGPAAETAFWIALGCQTTLCLGVGLILGQLCRTRLAGVHFVLVLALAQPGSAEAPSDGGNPVSPATDRQPASAAPHPDGSTGKEPLGAGAGVAEDAPIAWPGLIPRPADLAGLKRWQVISQALRSFVDTVAWSPGGRFIAIGDAGHIRICDATTLEMQHVLIGHQGRITSISWNPDGRFIASGGTDGTVRIWSRDGAPLRRVAADPSSVQDVAWSPDGRTVASGGGDNTVKIWNPSGELTQTLTGHTAPVNSVAWSPDGRRLASGGQDRTVRIWQADGTAGPVLGGNLGPVNSVAWHPDGQKIVSGGRGVQIPGVDGDVVAVRVWEVDRAAVQEVFGHERDVLHVAWDTTGERFVTVSEDRTIRIWNSQGQPVGVLPETKRNEFRVAVWSPDGRQLAIGGRYEVRIVSADGDDTGRRLGGETYLQFSAIAWSPDSRQLASVNRDGRVRTWQADGTSVVTLDRRHRSGTALDWSPAGNWLVSGAYSAQIQFWRPDGQPGPGARRHTGFIECLAWNPTGTTLASTSRDGTVRLWDDEGTELRVMSNHRSPVFSAAWRPDGRRLATGDSQGTIRIWRPSGTLVQTLHSQHGDVDALAWSPDGRFLAAGYQGLIRLWKPDADEEPQRKGITLRGHTDSVLALAWSPDGRTIASGGWDTSVRLWTVDGHPRATLGGHVAPVLAVDWSPDGKRIASAGYDRTLQVRSAQTGNTEWLAVVMDDAQIATFDAYGSLIDGDLDAVQRQFIYVVEEPGGIMQLLRPLEFRERSAGQ